MKSEDRMPSLGLYIQIPFCASKCSFCNFSSRVASPSVFAGYCQAVVKEIRDLPQNLRARGVPDDLCSSPVDTVYVGGGTPLIVGIERLQLIVHAMRKCFPGYAPAESTIEVTPGSLAENTLAALRDLGANRLSIGAQSFNDQELRAVGRLHTAAETLELIAAVRQAGFRNINVDLIAGLPFQTRTTWQHSLATVGEIRPEHASIYIFEIDEKSRLGGELVRHGSRYHAEAVPSEEFMAEAYEEARTFLRGRGYRQYEISNFALPGCESLHNLKYWRFEPYIGVGAGAHSFDGEHRWSNCVSTAEYENKLARGESPIAEFRKLSHEEQVEEFFFTGLRRAEGVDLARAERRWGAGEIQRWGTTLADLAGRGLVERQGNRVRLAESAYLMSNEVFQEFVP